MGTEIVAKSPSRSIVSRKSSHPNSEAVSIKTTSPRAWDLGLPNQIRMSKMVAVILSLSRSSHILSQKNRPLQSQIYTVRASQRAHGLYLLGW